MVYTFFVQSRCSCSTSCHALFLSTDIEKWKAHRAQASKQGLIHSPQENWHADKLLVQLRLELAASAHTA